MRCPKEDALILELSLNGRSCTALLDSGSSVSLVKNRNTHQPSRFHQPLHLETMDGGRLATQGRVVLQSVRHRGRELGPVEAFFVPHLPLGVDLVLGLPVLQQHGVWIGETEGKASIRWGPVGAVGSVVCQESLAVETIEEEDFVAWFQEGKWCMKWKWKKDTRIPFGPVSYKIKPEVEARFDAEVTEWIKEGILVPWEESKHGNVKHFIPLMAVAQRKGEEEKVRPVLDYRSLNSTIESRPGGATPLCRDRLREWRSKGPQCGVIDLRRAYLQIHIVPEFWCYQAVQWHGETFLLTRLGFGLSVAPKVMAAIVDYVLRQNETINRAASAYIDDIYINEALADAEVVAAHFKKYGLAAKEPARLGCSGGVRVLGLRVDEDLTWRRDGSLPDIAAVSGMTRREVHRLVGEWIGHYPVGGWLRICCAFLQRSTALDGKNWDEPVGDDVVMQLEEVIELLQKRGDPVKGRWPVDTESDVILWTDASLIAAGAVLEVDGDVVEDVCWLRPKHDSAHINLAELDAVIRGISLAVSWGLHRFVLVTDSATVAGWLKSVFDRTHNVRTRALNELLIRRRLDILREVFSQERLQVTVRLVPSHINKADTLTRVPKRWLSLKKSQTPKVVCTATALGANTAPTLSQLKDLHERHHFGVNRTLELAREQFGEAVSRRQVRKVVTRCDACARVDPAARLRWEKGEVTVSGIWRRLAADITHVTGLPWLTVVDCGSGFTVWHRLSRESAGEVVRALRQVFATVGPPAQLLSDNGTVFRSREFESFLASWDVEAVLSCAWRPQGNGCVERVHRTIKRMVARTGDSVEACTFWYNVTHGDRTESPYEAVFSAKPRIPGVRGSRENISRPAEVRQEMNPPADSGIERNPYSLGDRVYLRPPSGRCDEPWSGPHRVTSVRSAVAIELNMDGVTRHIAHVRRVPRPLSPSTRTSSGSSDDDEDGGSASSEVARSGRPVRRRQAPRWLRDFVT